MEEQTLHYYLKIFSIITIVILTYLIFITNFKKINLYSNDVIISKGQSIDLIVNLNIEEENQINLKLYIFLLKLYNSIFAEVHYGNFQFKNNINFINFLSIISNPSNVIEKVTIVEGWSTYELNKILDKHFENVNTIKYEDIIADTYFINKNENFNYFIDKLKNFKKNYFKKNKKNKLFDNFSELEVMIIGWLIEKEGLDKLDKKNIFSVIINRLNKNMRLQIDATVIFSITKGNYKFDRNLTYNDLKIDSMYNTYKIKGLPPKPISYVGTKTIELMLENYNTDYLFYFFDKFQNKHIYSKNYNEHIRKLNDYRSKK